MHTKCKFRECPEKKHNGCFVDTDTFCVLCEKANLKVNNIIKKGLYDVVKVSWLVKCIDSNRLLPW